MADTKTAVAEPTVDWKSAEEKLKAIETKVMEYVGKSGYNPFTWLKNKGLTDIRTRLNNGKKVKEDYDTIMKTSFEEPKVDVVVVAQKV